MARRGLTLNQKLALLPATVPDCVLDFLEDFNNPEPLQGDTKSQQSIRADYLEKNRGALVEALKEMRSLGELKSVEPHSLPRQYPGGLFVKLVFDQGVRGLGFIVLQGTARTGQIAVIVVEDDGFREEFLRDKLVAHYKK